MAMLDPDPHWVNGSAQKPEKPTLFPKRPDTKSRRSDSLPDIDLSNVPARAELEAVPQNRDLEREKAEILEELKRDRLLPGTQIQLSYHINAFLFLAFFPLGVALYYYGKVFGPSLRVSLTVFAMWWLNFTVVMFLM